MCVRVDAPQELLLKLALLTKTPHYQAAAGPLSASPQAGLKLEFEIAAALSIAAAEFASE